MRATKLKRVAVYYAIPLLMPSEMGIRCTIIFVLLLTVTFTSKGQGVAVDTTYFLSKKILDIGKPTAEILSAQKDKSPKFKEIVDYMTFYNLDEMVTASVIIGSSSNGYNVSYYQDGLFKKRRVALTYLVSLEYINKFKTQEALNYQTTSSYYSKVGTELFIALHKYFWATTSIQIPLGTERLADLKGNSSSTFIFGVSSSQSIRFMSPKYNGITLSVGLFEHCITSKVHPYNIGLKFDFGLKF